MMISKGKTRNDSAPQIQTLDWKTQASELQSQDYLASIFWFKIALFIWHLHLKNRYQPDLATRSKCTEIETEMVVSF